MFVAVATRFMKKSWLKGRLCIAGDAQEQQPESLFAVHNFLHYLVHDVPSDSKMQDSVAEAYNSYMTFLTKTTPSPSAIHVFHHPSNKVSDVLHELRQSEEQVTAAGHAFLVRCGTTHLHQHPKLIKMLQHSDKVQLAPGWQRFHCIGAWTKPGLQVSLSDFNLYARAVALAIDMLAQQWGMQSGTSQHSRPAFRLALMHAFPRNHKGAVLYENEANIASSVHNKRFLGDSQPSLCRRMGDLPEVS